MKKLVLLAIVLPYFSAPAQEGRNLNNALFSCSYYGEEVQAKVKDYQPRDSAYAIIQGVVNIIGLEPNFEIRSANIPNAAAVVFKGERFVLYNDKFVNQFEKTTGTHWAAISILAHEIGHHLNGHTLLNSFSRPDIELEADEFSGFILRKMGATLNDAQAALRVLTEIEESKTYPPRDERLLAIASGWNTAQDQMYGRIVPLKTNSNIEIPNFTIDNPKKEPPELNEKHIAFDVYFRADPGHNYFVTVRNNLVKVTDKKSQLVGVMGQSNKKYYSGMFYDKQYDYLYITQDLYIVNGAGKLVGTMKRRNFPFTAD